MKHLTAWSDYTRQPGVYEWIEGLLAQGEISEEGVVWSGADGSYAVGDAGEFSGDEDTEYTDAGSVADFLSTAE